MSMNFKKGDKVVQVMPEPIIGTVEGFGLCQETGAVSMRVSFTGPDGEMHERFFKGSEVALVNDEPVEIPAERLAP